MGSFAGGPGVRGPDGVQVSAFPYGYTPLPSARHHIQVLLHCCIHSVYSSFSGPSWYSWLCGKNSYFNLIDNVHIHFTYINVEWLG